MRFSKRSGPSSGPVTYALFPEDAEDVWAVYNLVEAGDVLRGAALRKVVRDAGGGGDSTRVHTRLSVRVSSATFDASAGALRVAGRVCAESAHARLGSHHSLDVWPLLAGANKTSPRAEFAASATVLVGSRFKLIEGAAVASATWQGGVWPNASSPQRPINAAVADCASGCLFDVAADATEHDDVAAQFPGDLARMRAALAQWRATFYSNNETATCLDASQPIEHACACAAGRALWGGFLGPYARQ